MPENIQALSRFGILIVDDDPSAIQVMRKMLREFVNVRFATSGADALRLARVTAPDLILLDGEMPGQSGFEVCSALKADPELRHTPVIFVTAHDDVELEARALGLGAADFLSKPVSAARLLLRVKLHLQLKQQIDELRRLSTTDPLTGLANRGAIDEALAVEWYRADRTGIPFSLLLVDVDFFKAYNDTYGHPAGDVCLRGVANALRSTARRRTDVVGRYGGEEFAVILADTPVEGGRQVAQALCSAVEAAAIPHRASPIAPHVTVSVGVSCYAPAPSAGGAVATAAAAGPPAHAALLAAADRALYSAKHSGRNRVELLGLDESQA